MRIVLDKNWEIVERSLRNPYNVTSEELATELLKNIGFYGYDRLTKSCTLLHLAAEAGMPLRDICEPLWFAMTGRWDGVCIPCDVFRAFCDLQIEDGYYPSPEEIEEENETVRVWAANEQKKINAYV